MRIGIAGLLLLAAGAVSDLQALDRTHDNIRPIYSWNTGTGKREPFFPFGFYLDYQMEMDGRHVPWDLIVATGSNMVGMPDLSPATSQCIKPLLDGGSKHGIKVLLGLNHHFMAGVDLNKKGSCAEFEKFISTYKDHPALLGWVLGDENETHELNDRHEVLSPQLVTDCAQIIRRLDPHHPIWQIFCGLYLNNSELILPYLPGTDVLASDQYFETHDRKQFEGSAATLFHVRNSTALASQETMAYATVLQGFGNDLIPGLNKWRIPSYEEFRWNVFSSITAAGSRGIIAWMMPAFLDKWYKNPKEYVRFLKTDVARVFGELKQIKGAMETGYNVGKLKVSWDSKVKDLVSWDRNFDMTSQILLHDNSNHRYFLIVTNNNASDKTVDIILSALPVKPASLEVTSSRPGKNLKLVDLGADTYRLRDTLKDHDAVIYTFSSGR